MPLRKSLLATLTLTSIFAGGCAHKPAQYTERDPGRYFGTAKVRRFEYPNGLKLLVLEDHSAPTFAYQTWYNVGSRDEAPGLTGLAHLFEHMMFKATKNLPDGEFDRLLEKAGAEGENAFTTRDATAYIQSLPADRLDLIARLEAERMRNLLVDDSALDKEREVVQNERRFRNENNPDGQLYERIYQLAFDRHSYRWPVIGYEADLKAAKRAQCEDFYLRHYAPNNATVVIVGDVDPNDAARVVARHYAAIPSARVDRRVPPAEPDQSREKQEVKALKVPVQKLVVGYRIPEVRHPDFAAIEVLGNVLAGGKSSRLYRKLVDGGIATTADFYSGEHKDPGLLLFWINMQKGRTARQALPAIDAELAAIARGRITPDEIRRAVAGYRFNLFDGQASPYSKAKFLGSYETLAGDFEHGIRIAEAVTKVTAEDLIRVARAYFKGINRSVLFGVPMGKGTGGKES